MKVNFIPLNKNKTTHMMMHAILYIDDNSKQQMFQSKVNQLNFQAILEGKGLEDIYLDIPIENLATDNFLEVGFSFNVPNNNINFPQNVELNISYVSSFSDKPLHVFSTAILATEVDE
ncbi:hypothetical protein FP435_04815 [Lactobacillus sp. PV037]|uniref:hypothetical protein n=1 Tax=Lactobacillus sp. PV037 TaxID=2594496 RepID=UPI00223ED6F2|nr:hypothetical protein [Lactobacillus sp. PV037]QNQ83813.1 hypothetical protein FP435_04815 [Lactobacillus sp. PV037]